MLNVLYVFTFLAGFIYLAMISILFVLNVNAGELIEGGGFYILVALLIGIFNVVVLILSKKESILNDYSLGRFIILIFWVLLNEILLFVLRFEIGTLGYFFAISILSVPILYITKRNYFAKIILVLSVGYIFITLILTIINGLRGTMMI